ncbi:MAG: hypothetical protein HYS78_00430 [Parcubacteria group bacterium]|nr:hypothetical protein [Parcubacteria group bacterium]
MKLEPAPKEVAMDFRPIPLSLSPWLLQGGQSVPIGTLGTTTVFLARSSEGLAVTTPHANFTVRGETPEAVQEAVEELKRFQKRNQKVRF